MGKCKNTLFTEWNQSLDMQVARTDQSGGLCWSYQQIYVIICVKLGDCWSFPLSYLQMIPANILNCSSTCLPHHLHAWETAPKLAQYRILSPCICQQCPNSDQNQDNLEPADNKSMPILMCHSTPTTVELRNDPCNLSSTILLTVYALKLSVYPEDIKTFIFSEL